VQRQGVETIGGGLFASGLPVGPDDEALRRSKHLKALVGALKQNIEIPLGVAEEVLERLALVIPGSEDEAAVEGHPSLLQAEFGLAHHRAVHAFLLHRGGQEVTVGTEGPAVVDALVDRRIARIHGGDLHASMRAHVEGHTYLAILAAGHDHRIRPHVTHDEVVLGGDFGFMAKEQPAMPEDPLHFQVVDLVVRQGPHLHFAGVDLDQILDFRAVGQHIPCGCQSSLLWVCSLGERMGLFFFGRYCAYATGFVTRVRNMPMPSISSSITSSGLRKRSCSRPHPLPTVPEPSTSPG
jgi:hypothetical protein